MSFVQVPPDSSGKLIATYEVAGQQQQIVTLADSSGVEIVPLTDTELRAAPVIVEANNLPPGAASETTLSALAVKTAAASSDMPSQNTESTPVRQAPQKYWDWSFAQAISGNIDLSKGVLVHTGSGQTVNQTAGNLVIAAGTTANAETVIRSLESFSGALTFKQVTTLSQRIANNNFYVELVDVIGDGLAYNIVNATTVDVSKTSHGYTAENIGQRMDLCALSSVGVQMEGVIASIPDADTIRFTVAGWPASGSGTLSLTGWNKYELLYTGASPTGVNFNTRRQGYQNTSTNTTVVTSAAAHMLSLNCSSGICSLSDKLVTTLGVLTNRANYDTNCPEPGVELFVQVRAKNGTTNPASGTTWTIGMFRVEDYIAQQVEITGTRQQSTNTSLPVNIIGTTPVSLASTTVTSITGASIAEDAAATANPLIVGGVVRTATTPITLVAGDSVRNTMTSSGALTQKPYAVPEADWSYAAASGGIINTTDVVLKAAAGASLRNYLTSISIQNASATISTEVVVKDGSTVIFRCFVGTQALLNSVVNITFPSPLKSSANAALNVACITTAAAVYVNAQGYVGA